MSFESFYTPYEAVELLDGDVVAVLAPHPDDEVFGCAGLLYALTESGADVRVLVISDGAEQGVDIASGNQRQEESRAAADLLGYPEPTFLGFADGQLIENSVLQEKISEWLVDIKPDLVLAPSIWEMHRDHRAVAYAALNSMAALSPETLLAMYEVGVPLLPNRLVDITPTMDVKAEAMACFGSQLEVQDYDKHIQGLNRFRAYTLGKSVKAAEAYFVVTQAEAVVLAGESAPDRINSVLLEAEKQVDTLQGERDLFQADLVKVQRDLLSVQQDFLATQDRLLEVSNENARLTAQGLHSAAEAQGLKESVDALKRQEELYKTREKDQVRQEQEQKNRIANLKAQLDALKVQAKESETRYQSSEAQVHELRAHLHNVFVSTSWRLTAPMRLVLGGLKGERNLRAEAPMLLRKLWYRLPLPRGLKGRIRALPGRIQRYVFSFTESSSNRVAAKNLIDRRVAFAEEVQAPSHCKPVELDISVVTYNSEKLLDAFMTSLAAQDYPLHKINLRFVDNDSKDGTVQELLRLKDRYDECFATVEVIERPNNGFGAGHNAGIQAGSAAYVLVVNPDIEFVRDSLTNLVFSALSDRRDVACWEARQKPYEHPKLYDPVTLETNWCSHACVLLKRSAMDDIGGYDERIFLYGEDVEVSYRLREAGYALRYVPSAAVWHYTYDSAGEVKPAQYVGSIIGNIYLRTRYGTVNDMLFVAPLICAIMLQSPFKGSRRKLVHDLFTRYLRYLPQLLMERKANKVAAFPFRLLDYEQQREGAFWEAKKPVVEPEELPLVSIVTRTVAGRDKLLKQAGLSVLNQTYPNIEWVVVEDGGQAQREVVDSLIEGQAGIKVTYEGLAKVGRSAAGNRGMEIASGAWLMFLDDDDCLYADHVETLMAELLENKDAAAAYSLAWEVESIVKNGGREIVEGTYHQVPGLRQPYDYDKLRQCNYIPIQAILFKADLFKTRGGFDTDLDYLEDWHIWQRYAHNNRFVYVPKTTSLYRTPMDTADRARRQQLLDDAYMDVKERSRKAIALIDMQEEMVEV